MFSGQTPRKADVSSVCLLLSTHNCPDDLGLRKPYFHCSGPVVGAGSHQDYRQNPAEALGKLVEVRRDDRLYVWRVFRDAAEGIPVTPGPEGTREERVSPWRICASRD